MEEENLYLLRGIVGKICERLKMRGGKNKDDKFTAATEQLPDDCS